MNPFEGATRDEDGALVYKVEESELASFDTSDEESLKQLYETRKQKTYDTWDVDEEDEEAFRLGLMAELEGRKTPFDIEKMHEQLNKELGVFKSGEKYDVVKDLKDAYADSLASSTEQKIFDTIPAHYFWDIKRPLQKPTFTRENRYNPFRGKEYENFFEQRDAEEYFERQEKKTNTNDSVSLHRRY